MQKHALVKQLHCSIALTLEDLQLGNVKNSNPKTTVYIDAGSVICRFQRMEVCEVAGPSVAYSPKQLFFITF